MTDWLTRPNCYVSVRASLGQGNILSQYTAIRLDSVVKDVTVISKTKT